MKGHLKVVIWCIFLLLQLRAFAGFYIVTDTNDTTKITSLRGAIIASNRSGGQNIIVLGLTFDFPHHSKPIVYHLTIPGADESAGLTGDLNINRGETTIIGINPHVIIDATGLGDRVFNVSSNAHLALENLTITGGATTFGESGGAIYNCGKLTMDGCVIAGNSCSSGFDNLSTGVAGTSGNGGGIYNSGEMELCACIISNNLSGPGVNGGAGLQGSGGDGIIDTMPNPFAPGYSGGNGGNGGGIYNIGQGNINFSTINNNGTGNGGNGSGGTPGGNAAAGGDGGGIFNAGTLNLNTCTISQNSCGNGGTGGGGPGLLSPDGIGSGGNGGNGGDGGNGGGIYDIGRLTSTSCTIVMNLTGIGGNGSGGNASNYPANGGAGGSGGGIANDTNGSVVIQNTLVALNAANTGGWPGTNYSASLGGPGPNPIPIINMNIGNPGTDGIGFDVAGAFTSDGFNLIGTGDGSAGFVNGVHADKDGTDASSIDPLLGPLQMNGGFTPTHALLWGSPAIDQGNCFGIHTDQRGHYRPYIYSSIPRPHGGDGSDIGSFELDTRQPH